ncbi:MAG: hypothetical protein ACXWH1_13905 [Thermoanaerobaculia bacterium]
MSSGVVTLLVIAACVALGIVLAYVPMRLIVGHIANNVKQFIQRQRDRRSVARDTPDRRKKEPKPEPPKQVTREVPDRRKTSEGRRQ